jgi:hypothetical protein
VRYEPLFERFEATAPDGIRRIGEFLRAGFLTLGDRPELYFFRLVRAADSSEAAAEEVAVGISGQALKRFQERRRSLSREEKIDLAGLLLKKTIEHGTTLDSNNLYIRDEELAALAAELAIPE